MAIKKNSVITASDIRSKNRNLEKKLGTFEGRGGSLGDDSKELYAAASYTRGTDAHDSGYWNFRIASFGSSSMRDTYVVVRENSSTGTKVIQVGKDNNVETYAPAEFRGKSNEVIGGTEFWYWDFYVPPGLWHIRSYWDDDFGGSSGPKHNLIIKQPQTDISVGQNIRVWDSEFSDLNPEQGTLVTVAVANAGRLGHG